MKKLNFLLFFLSFILLSSLSYSQSSVNPWQTLYEGQGIKIEFRKVDCNPSKSSIQMEEVYLKFTNTMDKLIEVDWQYDVTYGDKCYNCEGGLAEMSQTVKLENLSSLTAECGDENYFRLRIFSRFLNMENDRELTDFHVKEIVVREISRD
ncbi:MAG: hypothetical protein WC044_06605 [Crocinitomicaceae bacterium]